MQESTLLWILGGMQAFTIVLIGWVKLDNQDIWRRINSHGHKIDCDADKCKPKTTAVIIHESER